MLKFKYYLLLFLLIISACKEDVVDPNPSTDNDSPAWPVQPVNLALPEVVFTDPGNIKEGVQSTIVIDRLIELIEATPDEASIYLSIYLFNHTPLINALKKASTRDVQLNIMMDDGDRSNNSVAINELKDVDGIDLVRVKNDASSIAINHNKFVIFSEVAIEDGILENLVFQSSHNFTSSGIKKIQDAVTVSHEGLYQAYLDYWQDMKALASEGMKNFEYREYHDTDAGITALFYPKRKNGAVYGDDTVIEILDDITDPSTATIKIGMSAWSDSRVVIIDKLEELLVQGAKIEIISKSDKGPVIYEGLEMLEQKGAYVNLYNMTDENELKINIHTKFMTIEGSWRGENTNLVFTGSQNFTNNALKNNNEVTLLFQDHEFFDVYEAYFEELKDIPGICCP